MQKIRTTQWPEGLPTGKSVITSAGNLKAKSVIHTVGPVWHEETRGEPELLAIAYPNSLQTAVANSLKTVAFASISTGAYVYPVGEASRVALKTVKTFLEKESALREVVFVLFSEFDLQVYVAREKMF